jgi:ABC-2 type transport system ATP-binding protein
MVIATPVETVIQAQGFHKRYKRCVAVQGLDLEVKRGEIYGLIGPDGSGKSSLMKAIAGVLSFEQGYLRVFDVLIDSEAAAEQIKGRLGFMPQGLGLNLYADLSIEENIDFFAQLRLVPPEQLAERKQKLLKMTRLEKFRDRAMKNLSGGMKQKLGLVCTLIHQPELVILDEPTTGVDPVSRRDFWAILAELLQEHHMTALISTAYMDEASRFHRLSMMYEGQVLAGGEPNEIQQHAPGSVVELETGRLAETLKQVKSHFEQVDVLGNKIRIFIDRQSQHEAARQVSTILPEVEIHSMIATEPDLEDTFIALLRHQKKITLQRPDFTRHTNNHIKAASDIAIEARGLCRDFGAFRAVDHVSFLVRQGEIFGLLGANGAGKTTAIKMLTGILPPTAGEGEVAGANMRYARQKIKERIGYMSQAFSLYRDLTVLENLKLYATIYGVDQKAIKPRVDELLDLAGLQPVSDALVATLPMGMRQRLALSCALVHQPRVLFLDEPTSGVDPVGRRQFWEILVQLAKVDQVAILVTTHYMSEAEHCDHLALMYAGRIIADDSPQSLKQTLQQEAGKPLSMRVDQPLLALQLAQQAGFKDSALFGNHLHVLTKDVEQTAQQLRHIFLQQGITVSYWHPLPLTLEDVFVYRILALEKQAQTG